MTNQWTIGVIDLKAAIRLDRYLSLLFPHVGRREWDLQLEKGGIRLNNRIAKKSDRVSGKETLALMQELLPLASARELSPNPQIACGVLYEDDWLFAVDKAAGIPTLPQYMGEGDTLGNAVLTRWPLCRSVGQSPLDCGLLQRLDTGTSGLVLGAKDVATWHALYEQMRRQEVEKTYRAWVCGEFPLAHRLLDWPIENAGRRNSRVRVAVDRDGGPESDIARVQVSAGKSALDIRIRQGARHQIRAHLAAFGYPVMGDVLYGGQPLDGYPGHLLHATAIDFTHPTTGAALSIQSPPPRSWPLSAK